MEGMLYNNHYIRIREDGCIVDGFSDAFRQPDDTDICINEQGGYQFRLIIKFTDDTGEERTIRTEENPALHNFDFIPLYKWDGESVRFRTEEEIEAERAANVNYPISPRNIVAGEYVTINGVLYLATENIPNGEPVIAGQNATITTVEEQLHELKGE